MRSLVALFFVILFFGCNTAPTFETIDGILKVPENRDNPNSRTLNLVYKVLKAKDTSARKAPIVILQGGPGGATLILESAWENSPLRNDRDIVLMDQRGTGESEANCAELGQAMFDIMRKDLDEEGEIKMLDSLLSVCKNTMKKDGVDLAGYSSRENAADFEDLRKALGYDQWNLLGGSYGSRLGLTIMRDFPDGVRSSVLMGILAPETNLLNDGNENFENSLLSVLERCGKNEACNSRYPNLKERLLKTINKIRTAPLRFEYEGKPFVLNSQDALLLIYVSLYDRQSIGAIPLLIEALENAETEHLKKAIKGVENILNLINWSMNYSVMVYEEMPFYDEVAMIESLKRSELNFGFSTQSTGIAMLNDWHSYRASDIENQPVVSEIPTLMTSGALDHVTPVRNAKGALQHLKNGYELIFLDEAHNIFNPCFNEIAEDFLNDPSHKPNMDCSLSPNPIKWNLQKATQ
jgi:pimeloyl-ACP methyl ester carboxylesterase